MDQDRLGSWSCAITSADGMWMTYGHHSKNASFSIRNYQNGALLYRKHLCQKGREKLIEEELYQVTSKGAKGYAARLTFKKAKDEWMNIAIQWQDTYLSSSMAVTDHFRNAKVMICGGHAGVTVIPLLVPPCKISQDNWLPRATNPQGFTVSPMVPLSIY